MSLTRGGRNLAILGVGAILFTGIVTAVSLTIYRVSGDIYLDRSRPGYLPDAEEVTAGSADSSNYSYPDSGPLDKAELDQYLKELQNILDRLNNFSDPFAPDPLSDESLGITGTEVPEQNLDMGADAPGLAE